MPPRIRFKPKVSCTYSEQVDARQQCNRAELDGEGLDQVKRGRVQPVVHAVARGDAMVGLVDQLVEQLAVVGAMHPVVEALAHEDAPAEYKGRRW